MRKNLIVLLLMLLVYCIGYGQESDKISGLDISISEYEALSAKTQMVLFNGLTLTEKLDAYISFFKYYIGPGDINTGRFSSEIYNMHGKEIITPILERIDGLIFTKKDFYETSEAHLLIEILFYFSIEGELLSENEKNQIVEILEKKCVEHITIKKHIGAMIADANELIASISDIELPAYTHTYMGIERYLHKKYTEMGIDDIRYEEYWDARKDLQDD